MDLLNRAPFRTLARLQTRRALQISVLAIAMVIVAHGLAGPQAAPRNLATVVTWVFYRGLLVVSLLAIGNLFCAACPMMLVRDLARRVVMPRRQWPRAFRNKWPAVALLAAGLFAYEQFDLWSLPFVTALIIIGYFLAALVIDLAFKGASFCRYVCPIGQFNFVAATVAPFSLQVRSMETCRNCKTVDCIKGRQASPEPPPTLLSSSSGTSRGPSPEPKPIVARGCELGLFLPLKVGNLDCTLCFDCVRACPHDNIGMTSRLPARELALSEPRSGIGRLARRPDIAALAVLFTFGGLLNAFAMTGTAAHWQHQAVSAGVPTEAMAFASLFVSALVVAPLVLIGIAAAATHSVSQGPSTSFLRATAGKRRPRVRVAVQHAYALVPLGAGIWLAHYSFHMLAGLLTVVPVTQNAVIDFVGLPLAGEPMWQLTGVGPGLLFPFQVGCILLGMLGSIGVASSLTTGHSRSVRAALPWNLLIATLAIAAVWALAQPMDMRGMVMPG
jgi:polyferredoxin